MSKSDAQRLSYLADQMSIGERMDSLEQRLLDLEGGTTRKASPTECGRIVVDANEWDRLCRLEKAVFVFKEMEPGEVTFRNAAAWNVFLAMTRELK